MPCNYTVGAIDTIYTEAQFVTAVNQANNNGGNITILIANGTYEIASTPELKLEFLHKVITL